jgi:succinoglycan biosynthesis protein ExoA
MILSVITPTLNEEKYIAATLESYMNQKFHSFELEILICDGMSTDRTRAIVTEYSKIYPNIRLIDNVYRKTPYAFNVGMYAAKGDYIAILGAHSKYSEDYLQVCFDELQRTNSVGCSGRIITQSAVDNLEAKLCEWTMLSSFGVSGSSYRTVKEGFTHTVGYPVFKKQPLLDLGGYDEKLERNQDNDMNQRLIDAGYTLYCTNKTKCWYRPPASLNVLTKYAVKSGKWNAKSIFFHAKSMRMHHLIPFIFAFSILFTLFGGIIENAIFQTKYLFILLGLIITSHIIAGILFTFRSLKYENDSRKIFLPFIFFIFHFSYGWGSFLGFVNPKVK